MNVYDIYIYYLIDNFGEKTMNIQPKFILHNQKLRLVLPELYIQNHPFITDLTKEYIHLYFTMVQDKYHPYFSKLNCLVGESTITQLFNVPTFNHYVIKMSESENVGIHMRDALNTSLRFGLHRPVTLDIFNDNSELYGCIRHDVVFKPNDTVFERR